MREKPCKLLDCLLLRIMRDNNSPDQSGNTSYVPMSRVVIHAARGPCARCSRLRFHHGIPLVPASRKWRFKVPIVPPPPRSRTSAVALMFATINTRHGKNERVLGGTRTRIKMMKSRVQDKIIETQYVHTHRRTRKYLIEQFIHRSDKVPF